MNPPPWRASALPPPSPPPIPPPALASLLAVHRVRVHRWRRSMSGMAWNAPGPDGPQTRWIEGPEPRGSMSWAIILHEVGHHALGIGRFSPRCLEEYHAWRWALEAMERMGIPVAERVLVRMHASLHYAVSKARRRGLVRLPEVLQAFEHAPPRRR